MSRKHLFNSSDGLVLKSLRGAVASNPSLSLHTPSKSLYIKPEEVAHTQAKVAVVSGGGAGHEPAHSGYTGRGMLAASVSGDIFASPSAKQILQTIWLASSSGASISPPPASSSSTKAVTAVNSQKPVLVIINNYTGDRLNFGLAIEKARAHNVDIEGIVVADDVSLLCPSSSDSDNKSRASKVGARGLGANVLVCKLLGAAAECGRSLRELKAIGDAAVANLASVGVGLEHCHVPGRSEGDGGGLMGVEECEIGLGLHNEPGAFRKPLHSAEEVISEMLELILKAKKGFWKLDRKDEEEYVLFINNLGGMSPLEMGGIVEEVLNQLETKAIRPARIYASSYMTSLNAPGFSISLLNLSSTVSKLETKEVKVKDLKAYLDHPTDATAWVGGRSWPSSSDLYSHPQHTDAPESTTINSPKPQDGDPKLNKGCMPKELQAQYSKAIKMACQEVLSVEADLTKWDTEMGDGDCGETFANGAKAILGSTDSLSEEGGSVGELIGRVGDILEDNMGGTIGALFAIFFTALCSSMGSILNRESRTEPTTKDWAQAAQSGLEALNRHTPAQPGDRTLIDSLVPFSRSLLGGDTFSDAVQKAREGGESTRKLRPVLGRAAYVGCSEEGKEVDLPPDPGAMGVVAILEGLAGPTEDK